MANDDIVLIVSERETRNGIFDCYLAERYTRRPGAAIRAVLGVLRYD